VRKLGIVAFCVVAALLWGCQRSPNQVVDKVLVDFGVREKPEGYVSTRDTVFAKMPAVAKTEIKRLNQEALQGEIKFQEERGLKGKYYKEVKVYEDFYPADVQPASKSTPQERSYYGYIEYEYRIHQGVPKSNRIEAEAEPATIPTDQRGRESYRYTFSPTGAWDGAKGRKTNR